MGWVVAKFVFECGAGFLKTSNNTVLLVLVSGLFLAGCSNSPALKSEAGALNAAANKEVKRVTPIVPGRPARMFVWAGFKPEDCSATSPVVALSEKPTKGEVSFRPNQSTMIRESSSGKCVGKRMVGTGIYYTARHGQLGPDRFTVTATTPDGEKVARAFLVEISE